MASTVKLIAKGRQFDVAANHINFLSNYIVCGKKYHLISVELVWAPFVARINFSDRLRK